MKNNPSRFLNGLAGASLAAMTAFAAPAFAQERSTYTDHEQQQIETYGNGHYLAYLKSDDPQANRRMRAGLEALAQELTDITALDPDGVVEVDLSVDTIAPFRYVYAEVTDADSPLSMVEQRKLQNYIEDNRTIVFDIDTNERDIMQRLERFLGDVNMGPMVPMHQDHALTQCFFDVSGLAGASNFDPVYVQGGAATGIETMTNVIATQRGFARAWATWLATDGDVYNDVMQAGVNTVECAYNGLYNTDRLEIFKQLEDILEVE